MLSLIISTSSNCLPFKVFSVWEMSKKSHGATCVWSMGVDTLVKCGVSLKIAVQVGLNALMYHGTNSN
jgi:hypothetical protein